MYKPHRKPWPKSKTSDISKHSPSPLHHTFLLGRARFTAQPLSALAMTNEQCSDYGSLYSHLTWLYGFTSTDSSSLVTCVIMDVLSMNAFKLSPNDQSFPHNQCSFVFTSKCSTLKRTVTKNYGLSETPGAFWLTENILRTVVIGANDLIFSVIWSLCMFKTHLAFLTLFSWWPRCTCHTHVHAHALLKLRKPIVKT